MRLALLLLALVPSLSAAQGFVPSRNVVPGTTLVTGATDCAMYADASGIARCSSSEAGYNDSTDVWIVSNMRLRDSSGSNTLTFAGGNHTADKTITWLSATDITITASAGQFIWNPANQGDVILFSGFSANNGVVLRSDGYVNWTSGAVTASPDTRLSRPAAGVLQVNTGWMIPQAGRKRVTSTVTNGTTTMANVSDLTFTLAAGRTYTIKVALLVANTVSADGLKFDFDGGTATATDFRIDCTLHDSALLLSAMTTALATDYAAATVTGNSALRCEGTITVSAGGTFIPRFAENSTTTGLAAVYRGSYIWLEDTP